MSVLHVGAHAYLGVGRAPVLGVGGAAVIADAGRRDFAGGHTCDEREGGSVLHCLTRASRKRPLQRHAPDARHAVVVDVCRSKVARAQSKFRKLEKWKTGKKERSYTCDALYTCQ